MSDNLLVAPSDCSCVPCEEQCLVENIPGPQGDPGAAGAAGTNGNDSYTTLTAQFIQPAVDANVSATVAKSAWGVVGQIIVVENGGSYQLMAKADSTHMTLKNLGYDGNVAPAVVVASGNQVGPGGEKGADGAAPGDALLAANNLSDVDSASASRTNLGLGTMAVEPAADYLSKVGNLSGLANTSTARTNLGVAIGSAVQAYNALLAAIAGLSPIAANQMVYGTGANAVAFTTLTALARSLLDDSTVAAMRSTLGNVLPRYGILGAASAVDMNSGTTDTPITIESSRYIIDAIIVENASANLTTATAGVFSATGGGGVGYAADQALTALSASSKFLDLTLATIATTDVATAGTLYFRVGTPQGTSCTANVWILGRTLS